MTFDPYRTEKELGEYEDGEPQPGTFVLKPETDAAARTALKAYALATENEALKEDLLAWVDEIEE